MVDIDFGVVIIDESLDLRNFPAKCLEFLMTKFQKIDVNEVEVKKMSM
jgi:hypothetical protein